MTDDVGSDFRDTEAARREAAKALGEIVRDVLLQSLETRAFRMVVRDSLGMVLFQLSLAFDAESPSLI